MTVKIDTLNALGSVLHLRCMPKYILIVDNRYHLYILNKDNGTLIKKIRLADAEKKPVHRYAKTFLITPKNEIIVSIAGSNRLDVFKLGKGISRKTVTSRHRSDIESVTVSEDGSLFATGGADGRVFLYKDLQKGPICSFEPRGEYISYLAFSQDNRLLASSGFDKMTRIYDLHRHVEIAAFDSPDTVEKALFFDRSQKVYAIARDGSSIVFDVEDNRILSEEKLFASWPTTVELSQNKKAAVIGTKGNRLYIVKLSGNKTVCEFEVAGSGITQVKLHEERLMVSAIDGSVTSYDCAASKEQFETALKAKDYETVKAALDANRLLHLHPMMERFDRDWGDVLKKAIKLISVGKCDNGCSIVQPFLDDPERVEEFNFYMAQKETFVTFLSHVEKGRFKEAYELADKEEYLKRLSRYEALEAKWEKDFREARKVLESNRQNRQQALKILNPFAKVPSKAKMINLLVENNHVFAQAEELVRTMQFQRFFKVVEAYPFLSGAGIYKKAMQIGENLYQKMIGCEEARTFDRLHKVGELLGQFPPFSDAAEEGMRRGEAKKRFEQYVNKKDLPGAFSLLDKHGYLVLEEGYEALLLEFRSVFESAEKRAAQGAEALELKEILSGYIGIPYWKERIALVMREGYINELRTIVREGITPAMEAGVREYIRIFAKDDALVNFMKSHGMDEWLECVNEQKSTAAYRQNGFPNTVLVG